MSSFDPFGIYSRRPYYNRKAQINRKKPVFHGGSVSTADLPYLEKKIRALGYKIDYNTGPTPPAPPDLEISEVIHSNINIILTSGNLRGFVTQSQIREGILETQLFSELPAPPTSFEVIENVDWIGLQFPGGSGKTLSSESHNLRFKCPHFNQILAPSVIIGPSPTYSCFPTNIGTEYISSTQVMFCQSESDNSSDKLHDNISFTKADSPENNPYTIGTKIYSGLEYYNMFKTGTGLEELDPLIELEGMSIPLGSSGWPSQINLVGVISIEIKYTL